NCVSVHRWLSEGDGQDPVRIWGLLRPGGPWLRCEPARSGWESDRLHQHGRSICGQVAGGAHGDRAPHQASRNHVQSRHGSWWRIILSALIRRRSPKLKVEPIAARVRSVAEIETVITSLGREPGGSLVVMPDVFVETHRGQIILFAARNNVPAVYSQSVFVRDGGLLSYGADRVDIFRRSASYVDRILLGAQP